METRGTPANPALAAALNAAVADARLRQGKYTPADLDGPMGPTLTDAATVYAQTYAGSFGFMLKMRHTLRQYGRLYPAQLAGVLNCLRADVAKDDKAAGPGAPGMPPASPTLANPGR